MQQMTLFRWIPSCFVWLLVALSECAILGAVTPRIEITKADLFETKGWDSTQVEVVGFHLAMSRDDAFVNAQNHALKLMTTNLKPDKCSAGDCEVCDSSGISTGITLHFGQNDSVKEILITRTPQDAAPSVRKAAVQRRFRGATFSFFNHYSDHLRREILGDETSREVLSDKSILYSGTVKYGYASRGVILYVSPNPNGPEDTSGLIFILTASQASSAR